MKLGFILNLFKDCFLKFIICIEYVMYGLKEWIVLMIFKGWVKLVILVLIKFIL